VENHPVDAEPIAHLAKAGGKGLLSNRDEDLCPSSKSNPRRKSRDSLPLQLEKKPAWDRRVRRFSPAGAPAEVRI